MSGLWRTRIPIKLTCLAWAALNNAYLTLDNVSRRKITLVNRCYICKQESWECKPPIHALPYHNDILNFFLSLYGLSWSMPRSKKESCISWISWRVDKAIKKVWRMIPAIHYWVIWNERNCRYFDGISIPTHSLKIKCLVYLFSWNFLSLVNRVDMFLDFVSSLASLGYLY